MCPQESHLGWTHPNVNHGRDVRVVDLSSPSLLLSRFDEGGQREAYQSYFLPLPPEDPTSEVELIHNLTRCGLNRIPSPSPVDIYSVRLINRPQTLASFQGADSLGQSAL